MTKKQLEVGAPFLRFFSNAVVAVSIVPKRRSILMRIINRIIKITNKLRLTNISNFMEDYCTTVGKTIYASSNWDMDMEVNPVLIHELTHVMGFVNDGFLRMALRYLTPTWRAEYESRCLQAEFMFCGDAMMGRNESVNIIAERFVPYGIPHNVMTTKIKERLIELDLGRPQKDAKTVMEAYKLWTKEKVSQ